MLLWPVLWHWVWHWMMWLWTQCGLDQMGLWLLTLHSLLWEELPPTPVQPWSAHLGEINLESTPVQLLSAQHLHSSLTVVKCLEQPELQLVRWCSHSPCAYYVHTHLFFAHYYRGLQNGWGTAAELRVAHASIIDHQSIAWFSYSMLEWLLQLDCANCLQSSVQSFASYLS